MQFFMRFNKKTLKHFSFLYQRNTFKFLSIKKQSTHTKKEKRDTNKITERNKEKHISHFFSNFLNSPRRQPPRSSHKRSTLTRRHWLRLLPRQCPTQRNRNRLRRNIDNIHILLLQLLQNRKSLNHTTERNVLEIKLRCSIEQNHKLRANRVRSIPHHGQDSPGVMSESEIFILEVSLSVCGDRWVCSQRLSFDFSKKCTDSRKDSRTASICKI